jgi:hypothetical protein
MIFAVLLILQAAPPRVDLVDEVVGVPAAEWRYVEVDLKQQPVAVACEYDVQSRGGQVRIALLTRLELRNMRRGRPHEEIAATAFGGAGSLRFPVRRPGEYAVIVENRSRRPVSVRLHVSLDFTRASTLSPRRQLVVILISFAVFFGIVIWSGRKLLRVMRL